MTPRPKPICSYRRILLFDDYEAIVAVDDLFKEETAAREDVEETTTRKIWTRDVDEDGNDDEKTIKAWTRPALSTI